MNTIHSPAMVPATLAGAIADLLDRRRFDHLLAGVLTIVAPHITTTPRSTDDLGPVLVDIDLVRHLVTLLGRAGAVGALLDLLGVINPYLSVVDPIDPDAMPDPDAPPLSAREREVLAGIAAGRTTGHIARSLNLTEDTVRSHVRKSLFKTGTTCRAHLVARAYQLGYLTVDRARTAA